MKNGVNARFRRMIRDRWLVNSSREHLHRYNQEFARDTAVGMWVLDAGAGVAPYRDLFSHTNYETADFEQVDKPYAKSTYKCDLTAIPVNDERFDRVIFNQVLEHVPQPASVLRELARTMKPGGRMICSCPLFYEEHEVPYDFYRYTQFGLRALFAEAGLMVERLEWLEGYWGTIGYQLHGISRNLPSAPGSLGGGTLGFVSAAVATGLRSQAFFWAGVSYRLDLRFKIVRSGYPKNYVIFASKPVEQ